MNIGWEVSQVLHFSSTCNMQEPLFINWEDVCNFPVILQHKMSFEHRLHQGNRCWLLSGRRQRHCLPARIDWARLRWVGGRDWWRPFLVLPLVPKQMLGEEDNRGMEVWALCWTCLWKQRLRCSRCEDHVFIKSTILFQATVVRSLFPTRKIMTRQRQAASNNVMQESALSGEFTWESDGLISTSLNANV